jgi:hypothetical protein
MSGLRPGVERQLIFRFPGDARCKPVAGLDVIEVDPGNVEKVLDFRDRRVADQFDEFLSLGKVGVYALIEQTVVGHAWLSVRNGAAPLTVSGYFPLERNQGLVHHCHVFETARGRGVYCAMVGKLIEPFLGRIDVLIDSNRHNRASVRAIERMGCEPLGSGTYVHVGTRLITYRETVLTNARGWR